MFVIEFFQNRSTDFYFIFFEYLVNMMVSHKIYIATMDTAKTFNRVKYKALLWKSSSIGFHEKLCKEITSFLTDRSIKIVVDYGRSDLKSANAGAPQKCVQSPTLFFRHNNYIL